MPIPWRSYRISAPNQAAPTDRGLLFTCGGAAIYHIGYDGAGLERLFPRREALTIAEFDAETSANGAALP